MVKMNKKGKKEEFIQQNISITKRHKEWIRLNYVNLSRFVQGKLDEVMSK